MTPTPPPVKPVDLDDTEEMLLTYGQLTPAIAAALIAEVRQLREELDIANGRADDERREVDRLRKSWVTVRSAEILREENAALRSRLEVAEKLAEALREEVARRKEHSRTLTENWIQQRDEWETKSKAEIAALRAEKETGRVRCGCGQDDAGIRDARCYNCRNKPYREIERLLAEVAVLSSRLEVTKKLLQGLSGDDAERLALDMDHDNKDHSRWYRVVKRARVTLAAWEDATAKPAPDEDSMGPLSHEFLDAEDAEDATESKPGARKRVGCERSDGFLNIHLAEETCEVCAPPASKPEDRPAEALPENPCEALDVLLREAGLRPCFCTVCKHQPDFGACLDCHCQNRRTAQPADATEPGK